MLVVLVVLELEGAEHLPLQEGIQYSVRLLLQAVVVEHNLTVFRLVAVGLVVALNNLLALLELVHLVKVSLVHKVVTFHQVMALVAEVAQVRLVMLIVELMVA